MSIQLCCSSAPLTVKWNNDIIQICNKLRNFSCSFVLWTVMFCVNQNNNHVIDNCWTVTKVKCFHCFFFSLAEMWKSCQHCHLIHIILRAAGNIIQNHKHRKRMQSGINYISSQPLSCKFQLTEFSPLKTIYHLEDLNGLVNWGSHYWHCYNSHFPHLSSFDLLPGNPSPEGKHSLTSLLVVRDNMRYFESLEVHYKRTERWLEIVKNHIKMFRKALVCSSFTCMK